MRSTTSLVDLAALTAQLGTVLKELEQQQAFGGGAKAAARSAAAAHAQPASADIGTADDAAEAEPRPPVSVADGLPPLPAPGAEPAVTDALGAPPVSEALLSTIRRARDNADGEPVNVTRLIPTLIFVGNPKCMCARAAVRSARAARYACAAVIASAAADTAAPPSPPPPPPPPPPLPLPPPSAAQVAPRSCGTACARAFSTRRMCAAPTRRSGRAATAATC
jgi:hypothetical protein